MHLKRERETETERERERERERRDLKKEAHRPEILQFQDGKWRKSQSGGGQRTGTVKEANRTGSSRALGLTLGGPAGEKVFCISQLRCSQFKLPQNLKDLITTFNKHN